MQKKKYLKYSAYIWRDDANLYLNFISLFIKIWFCINGTYIRRMNKWFKYNIFDVELI